MDISEICSLESKEFLERVKATPYTWGERGRDLYDLFILTVKDVVLGSCLYLKKSIVLSQKGRKAWKDIKHDKYYLLTTENIERLFVNNKGHECQEKALYVVNTTCTLARKMGLGEIKVGLWLGKEAIDTFSFEYHSIKFIGFSPDFFELSYEEIEYMIAHELAHLQSEGHIKDNWDGRLLYFTILFDTLMMICLYKVGCAKPFHQDKIKKLIKVILIRMGVQGIAGATLRKWTVDEEWRADIKACEVLNSGIGMVKSITRDLKWYYALKHANLIGPDEAEIQKIKNSLTPQGNNKKDDDHPPLTKRLEYALNFKPLQGSLGS